MDAKVTQHIDRSTASTATNRNRSRRACVYVRTTSSGAWIITLNHSDEPYSVHSRYEDALRAAKVYVATHPGAVLRDRVRPSRFTRAPRVR
ncbi:MAG: hypothetical protein JHC95_15475 [Solirubrobacteraceae bacterium]|nr:hypothetical protein [Solirubrobacteraceae bacterium]